MKLCEAPVLKMVDDFATQLSFVQAFAPLLPFCLNKHIVNIVSYYCWQCAFYQEWIIVQR